MKSTTYWYGWTALMLPLHMSEQLMFGIGELAMLKRMLAIYYRWFHQPDYGTVVLVTIVGTLVVGLTYGILVGGMLREIALSIWALVAIGEIHHIVESVAVLRYTPGTATAIPYVIFGVLLMRAVVREHRERVTAQSRSHATD
jgi:hypothetical protein